MNDKQDLPQCDRVMRVYRSASWTLHQCLFRCLFSRGNKGWMLWEYVNGKEYLLILTEFSKTKGKSLLPLMQHWSMHSVLLHQSSLILKQLFGVIFYLFFLLKSYKYFHIFKAREVWSIDLQTHRTTYGFFPSSVLRCVSKDSKRLSGACRLKQRQIYWDMIRSADDNTLKKRDTNAILGHKLQWRLALKRLGQCVLTQRLQH